MSSDPIWPDSCRLLEGRTLAEATMLSISSRVQQLKADGIVPTIAFVLMGNDPVDRKQIDLKIQAAKKAGFHTLLNQLPGMAAQITVNNLLDELSKDDAVHAVFGQLPFTRHISRENAGRHLTPVKDIDLLNPTELGIFYLGRSMYRPVVVEAAVNLMSEYKIPIKGANICILGLGDIVSRPLSIALTEMQGTVTVCHLLSRELEEQTSKADILITAIGKARFVKWGMVGDGAVVIDFGQSLVGGRVVGDVDDKAVPKRAEGLTPVPGGVGPVIIAQILSNSLKAVETIVRDAK